MPGKIETDAPTETWKETHRNLTDDEIRDLPFELKICFYLAPWNISASGRILSVNDWVGAMGVAFCEEGEDAWEGETRARGQAWKLIVFLKTYARLGWTK
jgi:hypothetical protein